MTEMHDVVEMLLNRMKDYPEDFVAVPSPNNYYDTRASKWYRAMQMANEVVTQEEQNAIALSMKEAKRAVYMGAALKTILSDDEPEEHTSPNRITNPWVSTTGLSQAQLMNNSISMDKTLAELEARVKAQEAQMQRQYAMMNANNTAGQLG